MLGSIVRSIVPETLLLDQCCCASASIVSVPGLVHSWAQGAGRGIKLEPAAVSRSVGESIKTLCRPFSTAGKWFCLAGQAKL